MIGPLVCLASLLGLQDDGRVSVGNVDDLPARTYELALSIPELLEEPAELRAFLVPVRADLLADLARCDFETAVVEQEVLTGLYRLDLALGHDADALERIDRIRAIEAEPAERLVLALPEVAWIHARRSVGCEASPEELDAAFARELERAVNGLPWELVRGELVDRRSRLQMLSEGILRLAAGRLQERADKTGVDRGVAFVVATLHSAREIVLPRKAVVLELYTRFIESRAPRAEIWTERALTLAPDAGARPVVVCVWDTGVDVDAFPGRLFVNAAERVNGEDDDGNGFVDDVHGIAFGRELEPGTGTLVDYGDLAEQLARGKRLMPAFDDVQVGNDTPAAAALRAELAGLDVDEAESLLDAVELFSYHCHGTHVAGIALEGNPFARLLVARVGLDFRDRDEPNDAAWARRFGASCRTTVDYLRAHGVRVVNMSWGWGVAEIVDNLEQAGIGANGAERLALARESHAILSKDIRAALESAPEILFVCASGNSGEAVEDDRWIPSTFDLENILVVGSVDGAGDVTTFSSFGDEVDVYADGLSVDSVVPGGERMSLSGTSMAAPHVTGLAAKLIALRPELTPADVKDLIHRSGETVERNGREIVLLHPSAAAELLREMPAVQEPADEDPIGAAVLPVLEEQAIPGAVIGVVVGDELVYKKAFGKRDLATGAPMTPDTLFQVGSMTKSMTAVLMGALRDDGSLELDDPISAHLEEVELPEALRSLTLRQLATHTAGLPRNAVNRRNVPDSPSVSLPYSVRELYEGLARTELVAEPGGASRYSNLGYAILGHVLERASDKPYEELLRDRLLTPLGMSSTGVHPSEEQEERLALHYWNRDDPRVARERWKFGEVVGHGGVFSCVDDLAKYVALQYATGEELPVRPETLAELHAPVVRFEDSDDQWLGTGWFVYRFPGGTIISHDGEVDGNSASIAFVEGRDLGVIALANLGGDSAGSLAKAALRAAIMSNR